MDKTVINFRLSELRKARHITQGELAEIVGTSFQTISKWENDVSHS
ncbi:MAG: helix-turn-helix transcriptional regulator [Oscillospiraceae bacterium]|nr:helix-turn-helix transcriptional regulator [Oscillospiraceae bacterium]